MPNFTLYYFNGRGRAEICRMLFAAAGVQFTDKRIDFSEWNNYKTKMPGCCLPVLEIDGKIRMPESMAIARYLAREHGFHGKTHMDMFRIDYISDCFYEIMHDYMRWFHEKHGRFKFTSTAVTKPPGSNVPVTKTAPPSAQVTKMPPTNVHGTNIPVPNAPAPNMSGTHMPGTNMPGTHIPAPNMPGTNMSGTNMSGSNMSGSNMSGGKMPPVAAGPPKTSPVVVGTKTTAVGTEYITAMHHRYTSTCHRILPFMEKTLGMRNGGSHFFMGEQLMLCDMMCYCCLEGPLRDTPGLLNNFPKLTAMRTRVASHSKVSAYLKKRCPTEW